MKELTTYVLNEWLKIEYYSIAENTGFIKQQKSPSYELITKTIRVLDYLSTMEKDISENYIISIVALMWEYIDMEIYDIKDFIIKILSRIGYLPSSIIVDKNFDKTNGQFQKPASVLEMVAITLDQNENRIVIKDKEFLLTKFQKKIWNSINSNRITGISAPTSAGKSFVILLNSIFQMIEKGYDIVYIVPTLSLVNQVTTDYSKMLQLLKCSNYKIINSINSDSSKENTAIYVLTQEKILAALSNEETVFTKQILLIVDEIQNIERLINEHNLRSKILYDTLTEFKYMENVKKIIIAGPRVEEIDKVGEGLFGDVTIPIHTDISPVLNLTYGIKKIGQKYYFRQYCHLKSEPYQEEIKYCDMIEGYGQKKYQDSYMNYLEVFTHNIGVNNQNIVFVPTPNTAKKVANHFANGDKVSVCEKSLKDLISYYEESVSKNYAMCKVLASNIAYHHGKLPMHVRRTLEKAITDKSIHTVVCTTTLMQGVNLPAQNVIIRNPHLYIRKNNLRFEELSSYDMANLRGRSGRLLKDFIGRTYVLDESGFEDVAGYNQLDLFEDTKTKLPTTYESKFQEYEEEITSVIEGENVIDEEMNSYGYLVTYIRQQILRDPQNAKSKLTEVGINLTSKQVRQAITKLSQLSVPKEVCFKNRYWDPFLLDNIYNQFNARIPELPISYGAQTQFKKLLTFLRENTTTKLMYERYLPETYRGGSNRTRLCKLCISWAKEVPLSVILDEDRYRGEQGSDNIEETIEILEKIVSFNIPLLLKPIYDMFAPDSIFLTCLQTGAYKSITRKMIEIGIPRETAIYLNETLFEDGQGTATKEENIEENIVKVIRDRFDELPYWIKVQLEFMILMQESTE